MDIDPIEKAFMRHSWMQKQQDENKKLRDTAIFLGSFYNYEAAKKLINDENRIKVSDEEFENIDLDEAEKKLNAIEGVEDMPPVPHRRRRRIHR